MAKELEYRGSFRFAEEYALAVEMIAGKRIDLAPLMTHRFPVRDADQAFQVALDRNQSMKVHLLDL
jgi:L-idonate 5-dehydrogenase